MAPGIGSATKFALVMYLIARVVLIAWSLVIFSLFPTVLKNLDLFGAPVLAAFDLASSERYAYSRQVDGVTLTFRAGERGYVVDTQTGSVWSLREGRAITGKYAGRELVASAYSVDDIFPYHGAMAEMNPLLAPWQRFDANWYVAIAERGYGSTPGDVHFPPLYPLLIRILGWLLPSLFFAAVLISNLALIGAIAALYQLITPRYGEDVAKRAVAYLLIFPTAFFFLSAYTEGLFLLVVILSVIALEHEQWVWAGLAVFCAILIRLQGIVFVVLFAYTWWTSRRERKFVAGIAGGVIALSALGVYLFLRYAVGEPTVVPTSEPNLFARLALPWENYFYAIQTLASGKFLLADALNFIVTTLCIVMLIAGWKKMPMLWNLYTAASLIVLTMRLVETQPLNSMSRYALTLFPLFVWLGIWGRGAWAQRLIVYLSVAFQLFLSAQFVMWGWVG